MPEITLTNDDVLLLVEHRLRVLADLIRPGYALSDAGKQVIIDRLAAILDLVKGLDRA